MNTDRLNRWLTLLANVGVVIGLLLLVIEIRQNSEMMRSQMTQSRSFAAQSEQQALFNSPYLPGIILKARRNEQLTDEEMLRYEISLRSFHRNQDNVFSQYNQGFLGESIPESVRTAVRSVVVESDLSLELWDQSKRAYTKEYRDFVDQSIEDLR